MSVTVKSCIYYDAENKTKWEITADRDKAVITKTVGKKKLFSSNREKKTVRKEYLQNLDIFFDRYSIENWNGIEGDRSFADGDKITIKSDGNTYSLLSSQTLFEGEGDIFKDLRRYLNAYFDETVKPISLSFHSFDGGGPEFSLKTEVKGIFTWYSNRHYMKPDHEMLCGAGYNLNFELYPLRKGNATALLTAASPICPEPAQRIFVEVDDTLNMTYRIETCGNEEDYRR